MDHVSILAIVGPTAVGKSALALNLAEEIGGEIISIDSMQIYRGMDIGTAKLSLEERRGIAHHMLDIVNVNQSVTVAEFQSWARAAIEDCRSRDTTPILVGGSALYMRAVLDDFHFPGTDEHVRARFENELSQRGAEAMHRELAAKDPAAALAILPTNTRRIVRALEVIEITGEPFSATLPGYQAIYPDVQFRGIDIERDELDRRITERVDLMFAQGLVDEVRSLIERGIEHSRTASRGLGYQQVLDHLAGRSTQAEAREATIQGTKKFARRQMQWFRKDPRIEWQRKLS